MIFFKNVLMKFNYWFKKEIKQYRISQGIWRHGGVGGGAAVAAAVVLTGGLAAVTAPFIAGSVVGRAMWKGGAGSVLRSRDNIQELNKKIDSLSKSLLADFKNQLSQGNIDYKESIKFYYQMNSLDVSLKEELEQMKKDLDI